MAAITRNVLRHGTTLCEESIVRGFLKRAMKSMLRYVSRRQTNVSFRMELKSTIGRFDRRIEASTSCTSKTRISENERSPPLLLPRQNPGGNIHELRFLEKLTFFVRLSSTDDETKVSRSVAVSNERQCTHVFCVCIDLAFTLILSFRLRGTIYENLEIPKGLKSYLPINDENNGFVSTFLRIRSTN